MTKEYKELYVNGETYKTKLCKKFEQKPKWEPVNEKKITAFIPGTIREIYAKSGKEVKKGESLLILEAMKMLNKLKAPFDGKIKSVYVKENQIVTKNFLLLEFE